MTKINSIQDLQSIREKAKKNMLLREKSGQTESLVQVKVAMATCCIASGSRDTINFLVDELEKRNINAVVTQTGCMGYCHAEPTIEVTLPGKEPVVFGHVDDRRADEIIEKYIKSGELLDGILPVNYESIDK